MTSAPALSDAETAVLEYLRQQPNGADILDAAFVDHFINKTGCTYRYVNWGAFKCPKLGRTLSKMYKRGILTRHSIGLISGAWRPGFPKWVYVYKIAK